MGYELNPEHVCGVLPHFVQRASEFDTAGLAPATGMHLRLDDPELAAEFFRSLYSSFWIIGREAPGHRDIEFGKELFRLIFVKIHFFCCFCDRARSLECEKANPGDESRRIL